jgi:hypothetical protein
MSTGYYIISGKQQVGPLSGDQILAGIETGKISFFDLIYSHQVGDWIMIMQHPDFNLPEDSNNAKSLENNKTRDHGEEADSPITYRLNSDTGTSLLGAMSSSVGLPPSAELIDDNSSKLIQNIAGLGVNSLNIEEDIVPELKTTLWYLEKDQQKPLKYLEVLHLLKERNLSEHTKVSTSREGPFKAIIEWDDFSKKSLEEFLKTFEGNPPQDILRRRHQRFPCGKVFIFAFAGRGFSALCPDISKSGVSFVVHGPKIGVGQVVFVKFSDQLSDNKFDAKAEIVGCRKIRIASSGKIYYRHAMRFTHLSESGKLVVASFTAN